MKRNTEFCLNSVLDKPAKKVLLMQDNCLTFCIKSQLLCYRKSVTCW